MSSVLSDAVMRHAQAMPQMNPHHDMSFPAVLEDVLTMLQDLPDQMYVQFQQSPGDSPVDMYGNLTGLLDFALYSAVYRLRWLLEDVISGLNDGRPMRAITAGRGVLELAVTTRRLVNDISKKFQTMSTSYQSMMQMLESEPVDQDRLGVQQLEYQQALFEANDLLITHAQATRVNWELMRSGDPAAFDTELEKVDAAVRQVSVMTLLDKYSPDKAVNLTLRAYYALQCEYTHPNRGGHQLVTSSSNLDDGLITYLFSVNPDPGFGWTHAVQALFTPLALVLPDLKKELWLLLDAQQDALKAQMSALGVDLTEPEDEGGDTLSSDSQPPR